MAGNRTPQTLRQQLVRYLREAEGPVGIRELGAAFGLSKKEAHVHLEHIDKSLRAFGEKLEVEPAECGKCGFVFAKRERISSPGRCPSCKSEHIHPPRFHLGPPDSGSRS